MNWGLPEAASAHAAQVDQMIIIIHWFMLFLGTIWGVFFLYCLFRFRKSNNPKADYHGLKSNKSTYLEAFIVLFEAAILIGFAYPLWGKWVGDFPRKDEAVSIRVVAEQFAWNFHYAGADGKFGRTSVDLLDIESNPLGLDREDPNAADDVVTLNNVHLPVDKQTLMFISSKDVIHSFKLVHMRVTQDAIPGIEIPITFTPIKEGVYDIACAQLCGLGHYRMKGTMTVQSQEDFDAWMEQQIAEAAEEGDAW